MNRIKSVVNSQRSAIIILLILNLLQLRELGLIRIRIKEMVHQQALIELEMVRYHDLQK